MAVPADPNAPPRRTFHALDGLRWVAAIAVMARHMPDGYLLHLLPGSYLAVDLFFCLSGFVLAHAYEDRLRSGAMGVRDFFHARVIRLWPLYLLATLIGAALAGFLGVVRHDGADMWLLWSRSLLFGILMVPTPGWASVSGFSAFSYCSPSWSLFWEMVAGMAYALIAPLLSVRRMGVVLAVGAALLVGVCFVHGSADLGPVLPTFMAGGARVAWSFFAGVAIYRVWRSQRLSPLHLPFPVTAAALLALFMIDPGPWRVIYDLLVIVLLFPALILASTGEVASRWKAPMLRLGSASYAVYLLHIPMLEWIQRLSERSGHPLELFGIWGALAVMTVATGFAFAIEAIVDKPVRAWLSRTITPPRSAVMPAPGLRPLPRRLTASGRSLRAVRPDRADEPRCV